MGTPQVRWRLMVQSGRFSSMPRMRLWPQDGTHFTRSTSSSTFWRKPSLSRLMNHWYVALRMTGLRQRQQCG